MSRHDNAFFHLGSPVDALREADGEVRLTTPGGERRADFVIFATGFQVEPNLRPELRRFAPEIRVWRDVYRPGEEEENAELAASPWLGPAFEFLQKTPGRCPHLERLYCFNYPSTLTHGKLSGDIPAVSDGGRRLAQGIARSLFVEDRAAHYDALLAFDTPELLGDEWLDTEGAPHA